MQIENSSNTLTQLLNTVKDQAARSADFLAPTNALQFRSGSLNGSDNSTIILEGNHGEPTKQLRVNDVAFDQISAKAGIDVRTARRLRDNYSPEFEGLINAIWQRT